MVRRNSSQRQLQVLGAAERAPGGAASLGGLRLAGAGTPQGQHAADLEVAEVLPVASVMVG